VTEPLCVNCDQPVGVDALYCGELCRQAAKTIRYARAVIADGRIRDPEVAEAVQIRLASVLGGGYAERERRLTPDQRLEIFERDDWTCRVCGGKAEQIDHIGKGNGDINEPANLQAICGGCHNAKTKESHRPIATPEQRERADALKRRIDAETPLRECDRADWDAIWRGLLKGRRATSLKEGKTPFRSS
jgi:5-methylcytosine-specific restriction endonuclease McrA